MKLFEINSKDRKQKQFVMKQLVSRELKRKYARSYLGVIWSVLNPLLSMAVITMIFSTMFNKSIENFPIYYLTGLMLWQFFSNATTTAMTALYDNKGLLIRVKISKMTFVQARVYTALTNMGYTCIAYIVVMLILGVKLTPYMLLLFVDFVFITLFTMGMSYILSILYVYFADIKHLYSVILTLWMYISAIFYPIDSVPHAVANIIKINPIYAYIDFARVSVMQGRVPAADVWFRCIAWGVLTIIVGNIIFKKNETNVVQKL